ncbi:MAG: alpha/beta hydrolase family protein [Vulcanimicrobiaceae bacterium]
MRRLASLLMYALVCLWSPPAVAQSASSREISFTSTDGSVLAGTISWPANASGRDPGIVLLHGSGPMDRDETLGQNKIFADIASALNAAGYVVLRYDKRGVGKSTTKTPVQNVVRQNFIDDAAAALAALASDSHVDPSHIYLLGHSEGGELALALALEGANVRGLVLLSALPMSYKKMIDTQLERNHAPAAAVAQLRLAEDLPFIKSYAGIDPPAEVAAVKQPVLLVHGGKDIQVTDADLAPFIAAAQTNTRFSNVEIPADDHVFFALPASQASTGREYFQPVQHVDRVALDAIVNWLHAH